MPFHRTFPPIFSLKYFSYTHPFSPAYNTDPGRYDNRDRSLQATPRNGGCGSATFPACETTPQRTTFRTNHFRTNIQPQFVSVFHCITNTSLQVSYANMETGYFCFHNAKLQILLLPIIQFYRKRFRNLYFPFIGDGNAKSWWNGCRKR